MTLDDVAVGDPHVSSHNAERHKINSLDIAVSNILDSLDVIGVVRYIHTQSTPSATWIINHGLGKAVEPTILLSENPDIPVWTDVEHSPPDFNITTVTLPEPHSGEAHF